MADKTGEAEPIETSAGKAAAFPRGWPRRAKGRRAGEGRQKNRAAQARKNPVLFL
jgi:hypothetical protein